MTIEKALEFAGDNSTFQKKKLLYITIVVLSFAVFTCKMAFTGPKNLMVFLLFSGLGQLICTIYLTLDICAFGIMFFSVLAALVFPFSEFLTLVCYIGMGFFGRGFYSNSLVYLNEIGGDRFRNWSSIVIFGVWGLSCLLLALKRVIRFPHDFDWMWDYLLIFAPMAIAPYFILRWKPSPSFLHRHSTKTIIKECSSKQEKYSIKSPRKMVDPN